MIFVTSFLFGLGLGAAFGLSISIAVWAGWRAARHAC